MINTTVKIISLLRSEATLWRSAKDEDAAQRGAFSTEFRDYESNLKREQPQRWTVRGKERI